LLVAYPIMIALYYTSRGTTARLTYLSVEYGKRAGRLC